MIEPRHIAEGRQVAEALLLAIDGDFLPGAGLSVHNAGEDVPFDHARPKELAHWAADAILASDWLAAHDERVRANERERLGVTGWHSHQTQGVVRDSDCRCSHGIRNVPAPAASDPHRMARDYLDRLRTTDPSARVLAVIDGLKAELEHACEACDDPNSPTPAQPSGVEEEPWNPWDTSAAADVAEGKG